MTIEASTLGITSMLEIHRVAGAPAPSWRRLPAGRFEGATASREVECCCVDAGGVPAEWVEAADSSGGQWTLVYFLGDLRVPSLDAGRPPARRLAIATEARVLSVGYRATEDHSYAAAIEDGVTAFTWLLGEGTDLLRTAFIEDVQGIGRAMSVLLAARDHGLPLPAGGVLSWAALDHLSPPNPWAS